MSGRKGGISRRSLLGGATGAGIMASLFPGARAAAAPEARRVTDVRGDGTYATVPLAKETITLGVAQSRVIPVDLNDLKRTRQANLDHMLKLIDGAALSFSKPDLIMFHEFPITGWYNWDRAEILRLAIDIPGPETEAVARKAREHQMYVTFGSYARDPAWPRHVLSITTTISPDGQIIGKHWKSRNIKGVFGGDFELFTTTVYDVLDQYIEMYGPDAVVPIIRTPIGNFATSSIQREPEYFRAAAMKGAEIILRTASGGFSPVDVEVTSLYNGLYTAICNNAISPGSPFFEDEQAGGSAIYGPDGQMVARANSPNETLVSARIPIAQYRARHRQPILHKELYMAEYEQYVPKFGPNLFRNYLPKDAQDAARYLKNRGRW